MSYDFPERPIPAGSRFASRLRMLRSAAGMTPNTLASQAGLHLADYQAFEAGRRHITAAALAKLAPALRVEAATFFDPD